MTAWQKALLVLALAWILTLALIKIFISSIYDVIPPKPPTAAEMKVIESRFFEMRPQLESVVDLVQSTNLLSANREGNWLNQISPFLSS